MKALILINMGSPSSEKEMQTFLQRMFRDKAIIPAPCFVRFFLSSIISRRRYRSSWQKYELIGGSPLLKAMQSIQKQLSALLDNQEWTVSCAYSYSDPSIESIINGHIKNGISDILCLPLYPQSSFSTSGSFQHDINRIAGKNKHINLRQIGAFSQQPDFIDYWKSIISSHIADSGYGKPHLLFSAHAIPYLQIKKGDTYTSQIETSASQIAGNLALPYSVSYQSKIGKVKWSEPDTLQELKRLKNKNIEEIITVPISFLTENLETLYDLDQELLPAARQMGIKKISRVNIQSDHPLLIQLFYSLIRAAK